MSATAASTTADRHRRIDLVKTFGAPADAAGIPILELSYPPGAENRDAFENIDLELALGGSSLS